MTTENDRDPLKDPRPDDQWITPTGRVWRVDIVCDEKIWMVCPWGRGAWFSARFGVARHEFALWVSGWRVVRAVTLPPQTVRVKASNVCNRTETDTCHEDAPN